MTLPGFVPGLDLARSFYEQVVAEIVGSRPHAAALLGEGSEVLGLDTPRSTDHCWGPRVQLFVDPEDVGSIRTALDGRLPSGFMGFPVRWFRWQTRNVDHHVEVHTLRDWLIGHLRFDPRDGMTALDWLTTSQQLLLEVTSGAVFHDGPGELSRVRSMLAWYPHDVWLWAMAHQWRLVAENEPFVGRTAEAGDELGSRLIAADVVRDVMRLCFMQERRYAPYAKWLGSSFAHLKAAEDLGRNTSDVLDARDHPQREASLAAMYTALARRHNALGVTGPLDTRTGLFDLRMDGATRPYRVLNCLRFAEACLDAISDPEIRTLKMGTADQVLRLTDELVHFSDLPRRLGIPYR